MDTHSSHIKRVSVRSPYRRHDNAFKLLVVEQSLIPGNSAAKVAKLHNVNANQVFNWRKQYLAGSLTLVKAKPVNAVKPVELLPVILDEPVVAALNSNTPDVIELTSGAVTCRISGTPSAMVLKTVLDRFFA